MTVDPSIVPGTLTDPLAPLMVPEAGVGGFAPVAEYLIDVTVGRGEGGFVLLLGTTSELLKFTLTGPLIHPPFKGGVVVTLVLG